MRQSSETIKKYLENLNFKADKKIGGFLQRYKEWADEVEIFIIRGILC